METYPRAAVERAMKVQEVIMRAMAKKITWAQAGEIIGLCERQMRRWKERYQEFGYDGLSDRRTGKPSPKRVASGDGRRSLAPVSGAVRGLQCAALSREVARATWHRAELHLGEESLADGGAGKQQPETRSASATSATPTAAGDAAAPGWQFARLVSG